MNLIGFLFLKFDVDKIFVWFCEMRVIKNSIYDKQHTVQRLTGESWHGMRIVGLFEGKNESASFVGQLVEVLTKS